MATIIPIKGLRYNQSLAGSMNSLVTPPYDVIDEKAQDSYYRINPYNVIRLEYGKKYPQDNNFNNRYTRAAKDFTEWLQEKILVPEEKPSLYLYEQEFTAAGEKKVRTGFIAGVKIEPYANGVVLPHEETLPKHKADRLALMHACRANFSPIFGLFADSSMKVDSLLKTAKNRPADVDFTDESGLMHRLWVISDTDTVQKVQEAMSEQRIFIADGHHRYETSLNYRNERRNEDESISGTPDNKLQEPINDEYPAAPYNYIMMTLVNLYDPGLVVFPTHRLVKNIDSFDLENFLKKITQNFDLEEFCLNQDKSNFSQFLERMAQLGEMDQSQHKHAFGLYTGQSLYIIILKETTNLSDYMPGDKSSDWRGLDVSVLHSLIMENYLGIGGEQRANEANLTYTREEAGALEKVDKGEYQLAFFMNPTRVEEVTAVASNGEKMPQKSTFFYPKLITGLVINKL
ncbi:conserved hypothetical protein [Desulfofarcimen acetoxidans DSM 771]|uniref:DUF1015 domain-containing protein n=1 Tax=Desulfofarcimen acetoxidans (strain ATCC 49208 / DSM 771 / KCTC 5769 / VKM B-1644 / 5575) TaxID=485916 RepID=C8W1I7_DESAS|nr:DUF1015 domain-containing protein [Desulfofarcimen acetoxidans]ACV61632.1 conserved hypothetical protein [Desulfofarcimen acetoxidans DSM 771]